jgi:single-strand DNA-binding protein
MRCINEVRLIGYVGQKPELRTVNDTQVAVCSLATTEKWKDGDQEKERTTWHRLVAWDKVAQLFKKYVAKGDPLYIAGRISNRQYEESGETRYVSEVIVDTLVMLRSREEAQGRGSTR